MEGNLSFLRKDYKEFKLNDNKQAVEETLIQRTIEATNHIFCDKG